jgi:hypothetical protein
MQPTGDGRADTLVQTARNGSGLATLYGALDHLVATYELRDAAVVVDVPGLGRQVFRAARRPLARDESDLHGAEPGLYLDPPVARPVLDDLVAAVATLAVRLDTSAGRSGEQ